MPAMKLLEVMFAQREDHLGIVSKCAHFCQLGSAIDIVTSYRELRCFSDLAEEYLPGKSLRRRVIRITTNDQKLELV